MPVPYFALGCGVTIELVTTEGLPFWSNSPAIPQDPGMGRYRAGFDQRIPLLVWDHKYTVPSTWFADLSTHDVRAAAGPILRVPGDWDRLSLLYALTAARCTEPVVVRVESGEAAAAVPKTYDIGWDVNMELDPWSCVGRRVWLFGAVTPQVFWDKYSVFRLVGVDVMGLVHSPLWQVGTQHSIIGGHLQFVPALNTPHRERYTQSLKTVCDFWEAMTLLYG